ncbi:hypothetical protein GCM10017744_030530 [Streptomyces antimycoticus]
MTLLAHTGIVFGRSLRSTLRSKTNLFFGMLQPLLLLALFGPLLTGLDMGVGGSSWQTLVPGVLVQLALLGGSYVGLGLLMDRNLGVLDRMRVTRSARSRCCSAVPCAMSSSWCPSRCCWCCSAWPSGCAPRSPVC